MFLYQAFCPNMALTCHCWVETSRLQKITKTAPSSSHLHPGKRLHLPTFHQLCWGVISQRGVIYLKLLSPHPPPPPSFLPTKNFRNVFHHFVSHPSTLFPKFESMLVRSCQYHDFTSTLPGRRPWFHCWGT